MDPEAGSMLPEKHRRRSKFYGWWYLLIGCGFLLLGLNRLLLGDTFWQVGLRCGVAAGFFALSVLEFRHAQKPGGGRG
jgi:uncharacterized membrane protein YhaH (DUF805 family)